MKNPRKREKENPPEAFPFVGGRTKKERSRSRKDIKKAGNGGGGPGRRVHGWLCRRAGY